MLRPTSVIDVGCGQGAWLQVFREHGVERVLGLDGHHHIDGAHLLIPPECFRAVDLAESFDIAEQFDLAACLEVAEHLPHRCAPDLVRRLTKLAPQVLFSAAVPFQGGVQHVNEQWPDFWRDLFVRDGFRPVDVIRKLTWKNREVGYWYRQNMFLYVREDLIEGNACFADAAKDADDLMLVHRNILRHQMGVRPILRQLPKGLWRAASRIFKRKIR